jgi:hypothetical protein
VKVVATPSQPPVPAVSREPSLTVKKPHRERKLHAPARAQEVSLSDKSNLQGNLALPDFVSFRLTWTATSTTAFGAYRATLASSPPRAPPLRSARYSATGVPRNLP